MTGLPARLLGILAGASLLVAGAGYIKYLRTELGQAQEQAQQAQEALKRTQATLVLRERQRAKTARAAASAQASLGVILGSAAPYSTAPVPQEIQDELCKTLDCVGSAPERVRDQDSPGSP